MVFRSRRLWVAVLFLAVAGVAAALVIRGLVDGGALRAAAEERLSEMLGQRVSIAALDVDLFPRLVVTGSGITVGPETSRRAPALAIARIGMHPRLRSLFAGPVVVDAVRLEGFVVSVLRDRGGAWHVPAVAPEPGAGSEPAFRVGRVLVSAGRIVVVDEMADGELREAASIDSVEAEVEVADGRLRLAPIVARVGQSRIEGEASNDAEGTRLDFEAGAIADEDLPAVLALIGGERPAFLRLVEPAAVSVHLQVARRSSGLTGTGVVRAPVVALEPLRLERFEAPFTIAGGRLVFEPTTFAVHGGTHRGTVRIDVSAPASRWAIDSRVEGLDIGAFLDAVTATDARLGGTAVVDAALGGSLGASLAESTAGRVTIRVDDGVIRQFPLVSAVNTAAQLTEGDSRDTRFERLSATLQVTGGEATTHDLVMHAGHMRIEAAGTIAFNRALDMKGTAVLSPERAAQAIRSVRELSGLRNSRGELEIPMTISGTLDAPSFSVNLAAVVRKGLADELMRRLKRIIRD